MKTMFIFRLVSSLLLAGNLVWLSSCADHSASSAPVFSGGMARASAPRVAGMMPSAPSSSEMEAAKLDERPGLGTQAGYDRYTSYATSRFLRKSSVPDAADTFHYNDEKGAKAMIDILGGSTFFKSGGMFKAAGGRLDVGLAHYRHFFPSYEASGRRIVIGKSGSDYSVRLRNRTKKRLEVVLSVDGLNTLTGSPASPTQHGYILEPGASVSVDGFRKNQHTLSTFRFGSVADSAAAKKKGGAANVGVIGLAVFEEDEARAKMELRREQFIRDQAQAFPSGR